MTRAQEPLSQRRRVRDTLRLDARRAERTSVSERAYAVYVLALLAVLYAGPLVYLADAASDLVLLDSPGQFLLAFAACFVGSILLGQGLGIAWGPLLMRPYLLWVFSSTDLAPSTYLFRRLVSRLSVGLVVGAMAAYPLLLIPLEISVGSVDPWLRSLSPLAVTMSGLSCWAATNALRARERRWLVVGGFALTVALVGCARLGQDEPVVAVAAVAGVLASSVALLVTTARRLDRVDLERLASDTARVSYAQVLVYTGTFHRASTLFLPEPAGWTDKMFTRDGHIRSGVARGAIRGLRTPSRACGSAVMLALGGYLAGTGVVGESSVIATGAVLSGAVMTYFGVSWAGEGWRDLSDSLSLSPLYGGGLGRSLLRNLGWIAVSSLVLTLAGAVLSFGRHGFSDDRVLHAIALVGIATGARMMSVAKSDLPLELLTPVITPVGDFSGVRVFAWQLDGVLFVLVGAAAISVAGSGLIAVGVGLVGAFAGLAVALRRLGVDVRSAFAA